jgi:type I restriction enzyme S subunit
MAQAVYREWFVHFRFPGHEAVRMVESQLGLIPEGWEITRIGEAFVTLGGGTPSTKNPENWENGEINWFTPTDLTKSGAMFISNSEKKISPMGLNNSSARLFPPYSVMMTSRATIGVVALNTTEACTNQGFIICIPNDRFSAYEIYYWILANKEKIISIASGATYKEISRSEFRDFYITIPTKNIHDRFNLFIEPIAKQIEILTHKNIKLRQQRDLLLPRLMSGALNVENIPSEAETQEG